jgi:Cdc6-like AAA superfamily ATPase
MRNINILSIIEAYRKLSNTLFQKLMNSYGITSGIKNYELNGIESFVDELLKVNNNISIVNRYYLGYSIPQIGKEFDLLRFGHNYIINIEIKTESSIEKILKQQQKNKYYLSFLDKPLHIYTFISNENKLYKLVIRNNGDEIEEITFNELCNILMSQEVVTFNNIDDLFNPSDYLVSPFNSPEKFMSEGYFLTVQQEQIYKEIQTKLSDTVTNFIALTGGAGTGKTLLTYHIAKETIQRGKKVLILHCAPLNSGHQILMDEYNWSIYMPKYAPNTIDFDLIIIDEAQRMYPYQFDKYIREVRTLNKKCIFSYDEKQYLRDNEKQYHTKERIEKELLCTPYKLTDKIRTNKEIAYFIRQLFNIKKNIPNIDYTNIELTYCKDCYSAKLLLQELLERGWKTPNYTPGTRSFFHYEAYLSNDTESAHSVVGQEFNNVVVVIDESFKYNSQGDLIADNTYYSQRQMLYQIITRTRKKLHIVIINNEVMLNRCIDILSK